MEIAFDIAPDEQIIFIAEAEEQLQQLEAGFVELEREGGSPELLQDIFRAAHTLKGSSGAIGHQRMAELTHTLETVLDGLRKGTLAVSAPLMDALLAALDGLRLLLAEVTDGQVSGADVPTLVRGLAAFTGKRPESATVARRHGPSLLSPARPDVVTLQADIAPDSVVPSARAFQILLSLHALGEIIASQPSQAEIESAVPVRTLTVQLVTASSRQDLKSALDWVSEVDRLVIDGETLFSSAPSLAGPSARPELLDEATARLGDYLVAQGLISRAQLETALQRQSASVPPHLLGQELVALGALTQDALDHAIAAQIQSLREAVSRERAERPKGAAAEKTVRTSVERLDNLMNLIGELITDRNRLFQLRSQFEQRFRGEPDVETLAETITHTGRITDQLQEEVMRIRMMPIAGVFSKFPRLVRDLARKAGKPIELVLRGEETELDRSVIEQIGDPLLHLIRNSVDHGLETGAERRAAGKPEKGTLTIAACHEEGRILLTVQDDGRGINVEAVKASAVRKGLITASEAAALSPDEAIQLIFKSGLSTATTITDISGRGVGMDIVRTNIERLSGSILVETEAGRGTTFILNLPLTLAIIPTLLVQVRNPVTQLKSTFALPLPSVVEALHVEPEQVKHVNGRSVMRLRERVLPLVRATDLLWSGAVQSSERRRREQVVAVRWGKLEMGLMVEGLVGEQELVVKSLGSLLRQAPGLSGAAILGDGRVALILDVAGLFKLAGG